MRALLLVLLLSPARAQDSTPRLEVAYEVDASKAGPGQVHVVMKVLHNTAETAEVSLPVWNPGSYRLQNHFRNVRNVTAHGSGPLGVWPIDETTWRIPAGRREFTVEYDVVVPKERFDADHFFFEGPSLYMYVVGHKDAPHRVKFKLPPDWKIATGLETKDSEWWYARDYDTFIDCPSELGKFSHHEFEEDGALFQIAVHAAGRYDGEGLVEMCRKIVKSQNAMFGGPPFKRYVFLFHFRNQPGGGGLEHLNSTNITLSYNYVKNNIWNAASITSHEYFHLWNVKRIRPKELGPFDYTGVVRSRHLWLCEGVTSYYGDLTLARAGIWPEKQYLEHLAEEIVSHNNNPDRKVTSVERASERVWDRQDWPRVDYYNKGELLGMLFDLRIRTRSENGASFDDVMRHLYDTYVVKGGGPIGVGFEQNGILKAINHVSKQDYTEFYKKYVQGTEDLPFEEVLTAAGLDVKLTVSRTPDLRLALRGTQVMSVVEGSEIEAAGIRAGDRLVRVGTTEVTRDNLRGIVEKLAIGEKVKLAFARGEETVEATLTVGATERWRCSLARAENATELQKKILDSWLGRR